VLYTVALAAFMVASARVPRVRAWYVSHVRVFALLLLVGIVALWVEIGAIATR
jgi:hypothetical protein